MDVMVKEKQTAQKLRLNREAVYRRYVVGGIPSVFLCVKGRRLKPAHIDSRSSNFKVFVKLFFYKGNSGSLDPWSEKFGLPVGLKRDSLGYKAFERYAKTDYGSSVIKEMISHVDKYKNFSIRNAPSLFAKGDYQVIYLPSKFPSKLRFKVGGQKIFDLAIIHHEFAHTMLVRSRKSKKITIRDELWAVRKAENPVRLRKGYGLYEPRYVYYNGRQTINIVTG